MVATSAVQSLIRESRIHQIPSAMQTGVDMGMLTLNQSLDDLVSSGKITAEKADEYRVDRF
jgi:twitching motility protein PilT